MLAKVLAAVVRCAGDGLVLEQFVLVGTCRTKNVQ